MTMAAKFYEIEQQKLLLDFEKIALFTSHPTSLGTYRERRLREYLRDFTPMQLSLTTGFVVDGSPETGFVSGRMSRQIDCLVYDSTRLHPELRTDDYVVIRPQALFAAIEVKSSLTFYQQAMEKGGDPSKYPLQKLGKHFRWAGTLVDALENIKSIKDVCARKQGVFFGVFGYSANFDWRKVYEALDCGELQL